MTKFRWWSAAFVQSGALDRDGTPLYWWVKVRPRWYWWFASLRLFLSLVWRRYDEQCPSRIGWGTAWDVAFGLRGITGRDIDGREYNEYPEVSK